MSLADLATMAAYAGLALLALAAARREPDLRWIAFALLAGFVGSNIVYQAMPLSARPVFYTIFEVLIVTAAVCAFNRTRRWSMVALVSASALSIAWNVQLALSGLDHLGEVPPGVEYAHALRTNLCYAVECLCVIWSGLSHELRSGGLDRWLGGDDMGAREHAAAEAVADFEPPAQ